MSLHYIEGDNLKYETYVCDWGVIMTHSRTGIMKNSSS